jgi:hypothetical protein
MAVVYGVADLRHGGGERRRAERLRLEMRGERARSGDALHRDPAHGSQIGLRDAGLVDLRDVRMHESSERRRLDLESPAAFGGRRLVQEDLQRDVAARRPLPCLVDLRHSAPRQKPADHEAADGSAGCELLRLLQHAPQRRGVAEGLGDRMLQQRIELGRHAAEIAPYGFQETPALAGERGLELGESALQPPPARRLRRERHVPSHAATRLARRRGPS